MNGQDFSQGGFGLFLSCLCGSERFVQFVASLWFFLSCLCGSELVPAVKGDRCIFLSCLCGSERFDALRAGQWRFLSCLCGSELEKNHQKLNPHVTKPRISSARP